MMLASEDRLPALKSRKAPEKTGAFEGPGPPEQVVRTQASSLTGLTPPTQSLHPKMSSTNGPWGMGRSEGLTLKKTPKREAEAGPSPFHKEECQPRSPGKLGPHASTPTCTKLTNPSGVQTQRFSHCRPSGHSLDKCLRWGQILLSTSLQHLAWGCGLTNSETVTFTV